MRTVVEFPERRVVAEEAAQWLIRLDADAAPSREELLELGEWLHRSAAHREALERLAALWGRMNVLTDLAVPLGNLARAPDHVEPVVHRPFWQWAGLIAAPLAVAVMVGWVLITRQGQPSAGNGLYATAVGQQSTTMLADGSRVLLNTNSQIKIDYGAGYRRVYLLQGEALFTVAKDPRHPFQVYAGQGRIEAVGTAFSVHLDGGNVNVAVSEGRVSLAAVESPQANDASSGAGQTTSMRDTSMQVLGTLDAGHIATIRRSMDVDAPAGANVLRLVQSVPPDQLAERLAWRDGVLMFSGETLEEVVKELGRYTTLSIEITDPTVRKMRIGGRFPIGETDVMLRTLQTNFNLRVTRLADNRVEISAADK